MEIDYIRIYKEIEKAEPKKILLQIPDGLKSRAFEIVKKIEDKSNANVFLWLGSCFGACDVPKVNVDLILQLGHSEWK